MAKKNKKKKRRNKTAPKVFYFKGAAINRNHNKNPNLIIGLDKKTLDVVSTHLLPIEYDGGIYLQPGIIVEENGERKYYALPQVGAFQEWCISELNNEKEGKEHLLPNKVEFWKEGDNYHIFALNPPHPAVVVDELEEEVPEDITLVELAKMWKAGSISNEKAKEVFKTINVYEPKRIDGDIFWFSGNNNSWLEVDSELEYDEGIAFRKAIGMDFTK